MLFSFDRYAASFALDISYPDPDPDPDPDPTLHLNLMKSPLLSLLPLCILLAACSQADEGPRMQITEHWSVSIEQEYLRSIQNGSLVFSQPEGDNSVWVDIFQFRDGESQGDAIERIKGEAAEDRRDLFEEDDSGTIRYAYRINEEDEEGTRIATYSFTFAENQFMLQAIYITDGVNVAWADRVARGALYE